MKPGMPQAFHAIQMVHGYSDGFQSIGGMALMCFSPVSLNQLGFLFLFSSHLHWLHKLNGHYFMVQGPFVQGLLFLAN